MNFALSGLSCETATTAALRLITPKQTIAGVAVLVITAVALRIYAHEQLHRQLGQIAQPTANSRFPEHHVKSLDH